MSRKERKSFLYDFLVEPKFRVGRHILFIAVLVSVALGQSFAVFSPETAVLGNKIYLFVISLVVVYVAFAYFNLYYLAPRFLLCNKYIEYFISLLGFTAAFMVGKCITEYQILSFVGVKRTFNEVTFLDNLSNLTLYTICMFGSVVTILFRQWIVDTNRIDTLENKRLKNSIDEIKNQINPDFLFNTIDYASLKVKTAPEQASGILFNLSELLRYELYDCKREKVILKSDVEFVRNYLMLEQQRSGSDFTYAVTTEGNMSLFIHPFIFMPIVQEIMGKDPDNISVCFRVDNSMVIFECKVSGVDLSKCDFNKAEQRLKVLYSKKFNINKTVDSVKLQLKYAE